MPLPSARSAIGTLVEYPSCECASTNGDLACIPAAARMSSTSTPSQGVSSFDQLVTQWISRVTLVCGSPLNSIQLHFCSGLGPSFSSNVQSSVEMLGVALAERTGKP